MKQEKLPLWANRGWRVLARRGFIQNVAGAGTGLMLGSELGPAWAQAAHPDCPVVPRPIPHITTPPGGHFFFPGPVDASPITSPNTGHDPSLITDFSGEIGEADLEFSGKGTNLHTGQSATYDFHCDMRFMNGVFIGLDNERHQGSFGFIWLDSLGVAPGSPHGSPLGFHSYDPGIMAGSLALWITPYPAGSGNLDIARGTARLLVHNVCSVFDVFTVPNSFDPAHALGIFSAIINSMEIQWSGVTRRVLGFSDPVNRFRGNFYECSAKIAVSATTPTQTGHGFHFESDPTTTNTGFAQFGTENNGVFFT